MSIVLIILLGICALHDLHHKQIPAFWIWICIGSALLYRGYVILEGSSSIREFLFCIVPGIIILCGSYMGNHIGEGDGWLIIAGGLYLSQKELSMSLLVAFGAAGLFAAGCLIFAKKAKEMKIPFVPFLFLGVLITCMGDMV